MTNNSSSQLEERKLLLQTLLIWARKVGYKNTIPTLPEPKILTKNLDNILVGFDYRLFNWTKGLLSLEHPYGLPTNNDNKEIVSPTSTAKKTENSLGELANFLNSNVK